jgi:bidirectional [NiFe] hydrogenase diaphorase subunit
MDVLLPSQTSLPDDPRVKLIKAKIRKENHQPDALIEILHTAQNTYGFLPLHVLKTISQELKLPPSLVYSAVSFYHFFSLKSKGLHSCLVCTGTACYVSGSQNILDKIESEIGLKAGEVSADGKLGVQVARCIGACGLAPTVVLDDEMIAKASVDDVIKKLKEKVYPL